MERPTNEIIARIHSRYEILAGASHKISGRSFSLAARNHVVGSNRREDDAASQITTPVLQGIHRSCDRR
jgi:hypothetical protein